MINRLKAILCAAMRMLWRLSVFLLAIEISFIGPNIYANHPPATLTQLVSIQINPTRSLTFPLVQSGTPTSLLTDASALGSARFMLKGPPGLPAKIRVSEPYIKLNARHSNASIRVEQFTFGEASDAQGQLHFTTGPGNDETYVSVGASAQILSSTPPDVYKGVGHVQIQCNGITSSLSFPVQIKVLADISVSNLRPMIFPVQLRQFEGTVVLDPEDQGGAMFSVTGEGGAKAVLDVEPTPVRLTTDGSSRTIAVRAFRFASHTVNIGSKNGKFTFPSGSQQVTINDIMVGASARYRRNLPEGSYHGVATLSVTYN